MFIMDFINEVTPASIDEPKEEVLTEVLHTLYDEFAIHLLCDNEDSHAYLLVQFGVGGPA
jgi:hypothetical protein